MNGGKRPLGYTIIEVMIVLAVSGMMFVIAANFINGKQARTAFTAGVNEFASTIQDNIEKVTDGQYSDVPLTCKAGTVATPTSATLSLTDSQGTQSSCTFLGRILHFNVDRPKDTTDIAARYEIMPLIGNRIKNGTQVVDIQSAAPGIADPLVTQETIPQQLQVVKPISVTNTSDLDFDTFAIAFMQSLPTKDALNSGLQTGGQTIALYGLGAVGSKYTKEDMESLTDWGRLQPIKRAVICVTDGSRYAKISIGGLDATGGSKLAVDVKMLGGVAC